jgi:hypothetical protein
MKTIIGVLVVLSVGCSSSPRAQSSPVATAQDLEVALEIAWEGVLGMSAAQRPQVEWVMRCAPDDPVAQAPGVCWDMDLEPDGRLILSWRDVWGHDSVAPRISTTEFSMGLYYWRYRLETGRWSAGAAEAVMEPMQSALIAAGL